MNVDWQKITESKRALRRSLAALPVAQKLRLLDVLRERELTMRSRRCLAPPPADALRETPPRRRHVG
jgi:hypothetical protein